MRDFWGFCCLFNKSQGKHFFTRQTVTKKQVFLKFWKIHKKTPVPGFFLTKLQVQPATLLKEMTLIQVFMMNFAKYLRHFLYRTPQCDCFCSTEQYFTNKIENCPLKKKMETAGIKSNDTRRKKHKHYVHQVFISIYSSKTSLFPFSLLPTMH